MRKEKYSSPSSLGTTLERDIIVFFSVMHHFSQLVKNKEDLKFKSIQLHAVSVTLHGNTLMSFSQLNAEIILNIQSVGQALREVQMPCIITYQTSVLCHILQQLYEKEFYSLDFHILQLVFILHVFSCYKVSMLLGGTEMEQQMVCYC